MFRVMRGVMVLGILLMVSLEGAWAAGSFVDNNDGTISDPAAALMWQKSDDGVERTWDGAVAYCESLELNGYTDWFLPKIHMLENLIESSFSPTIDPVFSVKPSYYWSSSESRTSVKSAKYVNFFYGNTYAFSKDNTYYSICVRDVSATIIDPLSASIELATTSEREPFEVVFSSLVKGGLEPYFYEWDFGDGDFSSRSNPGHTFQKAGKYEVVLTVSDNGGAIALVKKDILLPLIIEPAEVVSAEPEVIETTAEQVATVSGTEKVKSESPSAMDILSQEIVASPAGKAAKDEVVPAPESAQAESKPNTEEVAPDKEAGAGNEEIVAVDEVAPEPSVVAADLAQVEQPEEVIMEEPRGADEVVEMEVGVEKGPEDNTTLTKIDQVLPEVFLEKQEDTEPGTLAEQDSEPDQGVDSPVTVSKEDEIPTTVDSEIIFESNEQEPEANEFPTPEPVEIEAEKGPKGIFTVFASKSNSPAQNESNGQGLLAYSVVNALNGDADWNKDGKVTARELKGYLGIAIDNLSGGRQEAVHSMSDGDFSLCADGGVTQIMAVGIDSYGEETLRPLSFAGGSAEAVALAVTEKCLSWKKLVLTGQKTVRTNILRALVRLGKETSPADNFIFYFAGNTVGTEGGLNILTYDTLPEMRGLTGIFLDDITYLLENIPAANIIMLFEVGPYAEQ